MIMQPVSASYQNGYQSISANSTAGGAQAVLSNPTRAMCGCLPGQNFPGVGQAVESRIVAQLEKLVTSLNELISRLSGGSVPEQQTGQTTPAATSDTFFGAVDTIISKVSDFLKGLQGSFSKAQDSFGGLISGLFENGGLLGVVGSVFSGGLLGAGEGLLESGLSALGLGGGIGSLGDGAKSFLKKIF